MITINKELSYANSQTRSILRILQGIFFAGAILYFGKSLFIPVLFGLLIAIVMYPFCKALERKGWSKSIAIAAALGIVTLLMVLLLALLVWQIQVFRQDIPKLSLKLRTDLPQIQRWLESTFGFAVATQGNWLQEAISPKNIGNALQGILATLLDTFFYLFIVPVFSALFLYHRKTFVSFLKLVVGNRFPDQLQLILDQTIRTYANFIKGMVLVYLIVGALNSIGLLALGIKHALLFGMLTAVMTIIPYLGIIISSLIPISIAWLMKGSVWYPIGVIAVFTFVQYLEANIIFPRVVGTQLNVSTWATLIAIITGGILWGAAGMILFIPVLAIAKVVSDHVETLKPLNVLLSRLDS